MKSLVFVCFLLNSPAVTVTGPLSDKISGQSLQTPRVRPQFAQILSPIPHALPRVVYWKHKMELDCLKEIYKHDRFGSHSSEVDSPRSYTQPEDQRFHRPKTFHRGKHPSGLRRILLVPPKPWNRKSFAEHRHHFNSGKKLNASPATITEAQEIKNLTALKTQPYDVEEIRGKDLFEDVNGDINVEREFLTMGKEVKDMEQSGDKNLNTDIASGVIHNSIDSILQQLIFTGTDGMAPQAGESSNYPKRKAKSGKAEHNFINLSERKSQHETPKEVVVGATINPLWSNMIKNMPIDGIQELTKPPQRINLLESMVDDRLKNNGIPTPEEFSLKTLKTEGNTKFSSTKLIQEKMRTEDFPAQRNILKNVTKKEKQNGENPTHTIEDDVKKMKGTHNTLKKIFSELRPNVVVSNQFMESAEQKKTSLPVLFGSFSEGGSSTIIPDRGQIENSSKRTDSIESQRDKISTKNQVKNAGSSRSSKNKTEDNNSGMKWKERWNVQRDKKKENSSLNWYRVLGRWDLNDSIRNDLLKDLIGVKGNENDEEREGNVLDNSRGKWSSYQEDDLPDANNKADNFKNEIDKNEANGKKLDDEVNTVDSKRDSKDEGTKYRDIGSSEFNKVRIDISHKKGVNQDDTKNGTLEVKKSAKNWEVDSLTNSNVREDVTSSGDFKEYNSTCCNEYKGDSEVQKGKSSLLQRVTDILHKKKNNEEIKIEDGGKNTEIKEKSEDKNEKGGDWAQQIKELDAENTDKDSDGTEKNSAEKEKDGIKVKETNSTKVSEMLSISTKDWNLNLRSRNVQKGNSEKILNVNNKHSNEVEDNKKVDRSQNQIESEEFWVKINRSKKNITDAEDKEESIDTFSIGDRKTIEKSEACKNVTELKGCGNKRNGTENENEERREGSRNRENSESSSNLTNSKSKIKQNDFLTNNGRDTKGTKDVNPADEHKSKKNNLPGAYVAQDIAKTKGNFIEGPSKGIKDCVSTTNNTYRNLTNFEKSNDSAENPNKRDKEKFDSEKLAQKWNAPVIKNGIPKKPTIPSVFQTDNNGQVVKRKESLTTSETKDEGQDPSDQKFSTRIFQNVGLFHLAEDVTKHEDDKKMYVSSTPDSQVMRSRPVTTEDGFYDYELVLPQELDDGEGVLEMSTTLDIFEKNLPEAQRPRNEAVTATTETIHQPKVTEISVGPETTIFGVLEKGTTVGITVSMVDAKISNLETNWKNSKRKKMYFNAEPTGPLNHLSTSAGPGQRRSDILITDNEEYTDDVNGVNAVTYGDRLNQAETLNQLVPIIPNIINDLRESRISPEDKAALTKAFGKYWSGIMFLSSKADFDMLPLFKMKDVKDLEQMLEMSGTDKTSTEVFTDKSLDDGAFYDYLEEYKDLYEATLSHLEKERMFRRKRQGEEEVNMEARQEYFEGIDEEESETFNDYIYEDMSYDDDSEESETSIFELLKVVRPQDNT